MVVGLCKGEVVGEMSDLVVEDNEALFGVTMGPSGGGDGDMVLMTLDGLDDGTAAGTLDGLEVGNEEDIIEDGVLVGEDEGQVDGDIDGIGLVGLGDGAFVGVTEENDKARDDA